MQSRLFILPIAFLFLSFTSFSQKSEDDFSILFYNVENLFDTQNNSSGDAEFTPGGERHWTKNRLNRKLINISKVILNSSGFVPPGIIALAEVENRTVLEMLLNNTPLKNFNYKIIHKESPDHRGIDVALLYDAQSVYPLEYKYFPLVDGGDTIKTREILYFSGIVNGKDSIHFFVNHWPSRYEGLLESEPLRKEAALLLKSEVEEIQNRLETPKILILGDFNDQPTNTSISNVLGAKSELVNLEKDNMYNLSSAWMNNDFGTLKYQSQWFVFDQFIVSSSLLKSNKGYFILPENAKIVSLPFLMKEDEKFGGQEPFRTYNGYSYEGGFSDHLPIIVKLISFN